MDADLRAGALANLTRLVAAHDRTVRAAYAGSDNAGYFEARERFDVELAALRARLAEPGYANRNGTSASEEPMGAPAPAPSGLLPCPVCNGTGLGSRPPWIAGDCKRCGGTGTIPCPTSSPVPVTAPDWPALVAAVEHQEGCHAIPDELYGIGGCICDRDARIGRGIAAALRIAHHAGEDNGAADGDGGMQDSEQDLAFCLPRAARAFEEAS